MDEYIIWKSTLQRVPHTMFLIRLNDCSFILSFTHGISRDPPHAIAGNPTEIIREGAGSDARSIDLKVVPCTQHNATNIRASRYEPDAKADLNVALVNPVCRFAQVSLSLPDVIFNFNWSGSWKMRILAHEHPHAHAVTTRRLSKLGHFWIALSEGANH